MTLFTMRGERHPRQTRPLGDLVELDPRARKVRGLLEIRSTMSDRTEKGLSSWGFFEASGRKVGGGAPMTEEGTVSSIAQMKDSLGLGERETIQ